MILLRRRTAHQSRALPGAYRPVAWIERPYGVNVCINTGLYWKHTWSARIIVQQDTVRNGMPMASNGDRALWFYCYTNSDTFSVHTRIGTTNYNATIYKPLDTGIHDIKYEGGTTEQRYYHNGTLVASRSRNFSDIEPDTMPLVIFGRSAATVQYPYTGKIYLVQVWDENGTLLLDYVPCVRLADNIAGFWDRVNRRFITGVYDGADVPQRLVAGPYEADSEQAAAE